MLSSLQLYLSRQASSVLRYFYEQFFLVCFGWIPTVVGIALRGFLYRFILHMDGTAAIENNVRLRFADHIKLGQGVYLDQGTYLHATPNGIEIGAGTCGSKCCVRAGKPWLETRSCWIGRFRSVSRKRRGEGLFGPNTADDG